MVKNSIKHIDTKTTWQGILAITLMIVNNIQVSLGPLNRLSDLYRGDYRNNMCHIQVAAPIRINLSNCGKTKINNHKKYKIWIFDKRLNPL